MSQRWTKRLGVLAIGVGMVACAAESGVGGSAGTGISGTGAVGGAGAVGGTGAVGGVSGSGAVGGVGATGGVGGVGATGGFGGVGAIGGTGGTAGNDCGGVTARAEAQLLPTDVIWSIDTSGSMGASFPAIQMALNTFSQRIVAANIDAHIILLAGAGSEGLCVPAPLGSGQCGAALTPGGSAPDSREPGFLHLDLPYGSTQGVPTLLNNHNAYKHLLRPNARTQLVLTEDGAPQMTAAAVTAHVEGRMAATASPAWMPGLMPGSYQWNGIVCSTGMGTGTCFLAFGIVPQTSLDLVMQTQGLLRNLDDAGKPGATDPFADLLDRLAEQVIVGARVSCDYMIPPAPSGQTFDRTLVNVVYSSGSEQQVFPRAPEGVACDDELAWKYDNETNPTRVVLCPAACTKAQDDPNAQIDVSFGCETEILIPD